MEKRPLRIYHELAEWWPLFSPPEEYVDEAADLLGLLMPAITPPPRTLLELGAGGGSLAFHLKRRLRLTLTDRSAAMLEVSRKINPECEHIVGDMMALRLGREFDAVLIHDAIMYAVDAESVRAAIGTAYQHCRKGGAILILPDHVRETFVPSTSTGGYDASDGRGLRYLEWTWDPNPADDTFETAYAFALRDRAGSTSFDGEQHRLGIFSRDDWMAWLKDAGFSARTRTDPWQREVFLGIRT